MNGILIRTSSPQILSQWITLKTTVSKVSVKDEQRRTLKSYVHNTLGSFEDRRWDRRWEAGFPDAFSDIFFDLSFIAHLMAKLTGFIIRVGIMIWFTPDSLLYLLISASCVW